MDFFPEDYPDFSEFGEPPCAQSDPDAFFPEEQLVKMADGKERIYSNYTHEREVKKICNECPYLDRCLLYALENPSVTLGIWGGTTDFQRKTMRKSLKITPK